MKKVLNLYSGIGGNRKLWKDVKVTAIENNRKIADVYQDFFPEDEVIVTDAHQFLLENFKDYDFVWSSPPCPTHSVTNSFLHAQGIIRYPDMSLWEEIIFLKHFFKGKWVVENVKTYYEPLYKPYEIGRHYFWANFYIPKEKDMKLPFNIANARATTRRKSDEELKTLQEAHGFNLNKYKVHNKKLILRNCVLPKLALYVFENAFKEKQMTLMELKV